ncbi:MAG: DUF2313 domain-containing protein [Myxococcales bacterium]|nr:MAG: DUF2313 domain-containing protein [Myxococcales bacterium]
MQFSAFSGFGLDGFSGGKPLGEQLYDALWANLNGNGAVENYGGKGQGGYTDAKLYATAMAIARWLTTGRQLEAQIDPDTVLEMLPEREELFGILVPAGATLAERRAALRAAMRRPGDGSYGEIRQALVDLLGAKFVDLRRLPANKLVTVPDAPQHGPGLFVEPDSRQQTFRLVADVVSSGQMSGFLPFAYVNLDGSSVAPGERLESNRRFVLEGERSELRERPQVILSTTLDGQAAMTAILTKPHSAGATITTRPWPYWVSNRRHWIVELTPQAALEPEVRRVAHRLMARMVRAVSTWSIAGGKGPFVLGTSLLGSTPF